MNSSVPTALNSVSFLFEMTIITGTGIIDSIINGGIINSGNGENSIISKGKFSNSYSEFLGSGGIFLGNGNDSIIVLDTDDTDFPKRVLAGGVTKRSPR